MEKSVLAATILFLWWFIWFRIYGFELVVFLCLLLFALMVVDMILGFIVARSIWQVSSRKWTNGLIMKTWIWAILGVICSIVWHIAYIFKSDNIGIIAFVILWLFIFWEFTSIIEHLRDLKVRNGYERRIINMLFRIFNFWFDKWTEFIERKTKEEIEKRFKTKEIKDEKN